nr:DUF3365 domain-containing protein [candidate division Zixibacteria bacterium]
MKKISLYPVIILFWTAFLFSGCGTKDKSDRDKEIEQKRESGEYADATMLKKAADKEIESFMLSLKYSLNEAIREGGPVRAIGVCSEAAPEIAMAHAREGWQIWRLTDRSRNPNNQVNDLQHDILYEFAEAGSAPPFVIEWKEEMGQRKFYYYKPIYTDKLCLNCHGVKESMKPETVAKLMELYPDDQATGYYAGELRGMFMVEVDWPKGKVLAEKLAGDSL